MQLQMVQEQETVFEGKVPTNAVCLWVFKAQFSDDWFVELENEETSTILRSFRCGKGKDSICRTQTRFNAVWFGKQTAKILGIEAVESAHRGM